MLSIQELKNRYIQGNACEVHAVVMFREYKILRSTVSIVPLVCLVLLYEFGVV